VTWASWSRQISYDWSVSIESDRTSKTFPQWGTSASSETADATRWRVLTAVSDTLDPDPIVEPSDCFGFHLMTGAGMICRKILGCQSLTFLENGCITFEVRVWSLMNECGFRPARDDRQVRDLIPAYRFLNIPKLNDDALGIKWKKFLGRNGDSRISSIVTNHR